MISHFFGANDGAGSHLQTSSPPQPKAPAAQTPVQARASAAADAEAFEKERIELLRELKRVLTLVLEQQHESTELSEDDPQVKELLVWVERSLWHGLRRSLLKGEQFEKETHVTLWSILTSSKIIPLAKDATEDDLRDVTLLEDIKREVSEMFEVRTDAGRSRAWVRLALNKGVLGCFGWLKEHDARTFYEPVSLWRSPEQKSIAVALLGSLRGLHFSLKIDSNKLDTDPEPSRRPHFLGISTLRAKPSAMSPATPRAVQTPESIARIEKVNKEREALEALKGKTGEQANAQQQQQEGNSFVSWFKGALFGPQPTPAPAPAVPNNAEKKLKPKRIPAFLGSTIAELVLDPRTCDDALLDWRIGVPRAVSSLLLLIDVEESSDPFDPRYVAEEDDPRFVAEVGSLIRRLSNRETGEGSIQPAQTWDGGSPALVAAAALKLFFRQLPEPLIPYDTYDALVACQKIGDLNARIRNIKFLLDSIPEIHKPTLVALMDVVGRKCEAKVTDTLSVANALAPALLRPRPGPEGGLGRASEASELVSILIEKRETIFESMSNEIQANRLKINKKLDRITQLYKDARQKVEWPGVSDEEEWMKRAWMALAPSETTSENRDEASLLNGFGPVTDDWIKRGFRTSYMTHDFRGTGLLSLKNLVYMAETYPDFTKRMLAKHQTTSQIGQEQTIAESNLSYQEKLQREENKAKFPFILGAAQMSRAIIEMIGIDPKLETFNPKQMAELSTWPLFDDEDASGHIFALGMRLLDLEWTRQKAKAMDFNRIRREVVLKIADVIDSRRPKSINELRMHLQRDIPALSDFKPSEPLSPRSASSAEQNTGTAADKSVVAKNDVKVSSSTVVVEESFSNTPSKSNETMKEENKKANQAEAGHHHHHHDLLPRLFCPFQNVEETALNQSHVGPLESALPSEYRGYDWELLFSTDAHGFNLDSFFKNASSHAATILVITDVETKSVFGAFCSEEWVNKGDEYYGTGQSFLFTFFGGIFKAHQWTRANSFFMLSNEDCLAMGQGTAGFGFYIDGDLKQGTTSPCSTYGNDSPLIMVDEEGYDGTNQEFTCRKLELWTFVPKTVTKRRTSSLASTG